MAFPDASNNEVVMFTVLYRNSTVAVWWRPHNGSWEHGIAPTSSSISAVSLHEGLKAYALSGGVISEYDIDPASPAKWTFTQNVTTNYT